MSDDDRDRDLERDVAQTVDGFLLSLADGVHKAQKQLSQLSVAMQPGQPAITYQLPKLDFEFRVALELSPHHKEGGGLRLRPADSGGTTTELSSVIKGSLVAVPAGGGKPPPIMHIELGRQPGRRFQIDVFITSAAGEDLLGVPVQFNVDYALSRELTEAVPSAPHLEFTPETDLWHGLVETDDRGRAVNVLEVADQVPVGAFVAVRVDAIGETQTVVFKVETEP